jgi:hypothetical protein
MVHKNVRRMRLIVATALLCLLNAIAHANGRMPAATALAIHPTDERQMLLGLTYGLALTRDGGASWSWMCEQQIEGNGGTLDPAVVVTGDGTLVVLSLTNGGVLVSRDDGCTFERTMTGVAHAQRGTDLTLDPSRSGRVLALMSTVIDSADKGALRYHNIIAHSLDHARSWELLAELSDDMQPLTIEVAASDPNRVYVTATSTTDRLQGIVERSDDGGLSWKRNTVRLPQGTGTMFISAIHPTDPDRLWVRVPGYGDVFGVLPARLWLSTDAGASFEQVSDTQGGMLGFALSPDGNQIVYGGPLDGMYVAPADASAAPAKVSDMPVSCLRWRSTGLFACALESGNPFSLGVAQGPTQDFSSLWQRAETCRPTCAPPSPLESKCQMPWEQLAPTIGAETAVCDVSTSIADAGVRADDQTTEAKLDGGCSEVVSGSSGTRDPTHTARPEAGCAVTYFHESPSWLTPLWLLALFGTRRCRFPAPRA